MGQSKRRPPFGVGFGLGGNLDDTQMKVHPFQSKSIGANHKQKF